MKRKTENIDLKKCLENKSCKGNDNQSIDKKDCENLNKYRTMKENEMNFETLKQEIKKEIENKKRNMQTNTKFMNGKHKNIVWWYYPIYSEETFQMVNHFQTFIRQYPDLFLKCDSEDRSVYGYTCYYDTSVKICKEKTHNGSESNNNNNGLNNYCYKYPLGMILKNFLWPSHPLNNESFEMLIQQTLKKNKQFHQKRFSSKDKVEENEWMDDSFRLSICLASAVIDLCSKLNESYEKSNVYGSFSIKCLTFKEFQNLSEKILTDYIFLESNIPILKMSDLTKMISQSSNQWRLCFFPFLSLLEPSPFEANEKRKQNLFELQLPFDYCFGWNSLVRSIVGDIFQISCKKKYNKNYKIDSLQEIDDNESDILSTLNESDWIFSMIHRFFDVLSFPYCEDFYQRSLIHSYDENSFDTSEIIYEEKNENEKKHDNDPFKQGQHQSIKGWNTNLSEKESSTLLEKRETQSNLLNDNLIEIEDIDEKSVNQKEIDLENNNNEKINMETERKNQETVLMDRVRYYSEILQVYLEQHRKNTNWPLIYFDFHSHHFRSKFHCCEPFFSLSLDKDALIFENDQSLSFSNLFLFSSMNIDDNLKDDEEENEVSLSREENINESEQSSESNLSNVSFLSQQRIKSNIISKNNQCKLINERIIPIRIYDVEVKNQLPLLFEWMQYTEIFINFPVLIYILWNDKQRKLSVALFMRHSIIDTNLFYKLSRFQTEDPSNIPLFQRNISMLNQCFGNFLRAWSYFLCTQSYPINDSFPFTLKDLFYKIRLLHENDTNGTYMCIGLDIWSYLLPIDSITELQQELSTVKQLFRKKYHSGNLFKETHTILHERYICLLTYGYILEDHQKKQKVHPIIESFFESTHLFFPYFTNLDRKTFSSSHSSSAPFIIDDSIEKQTNYIISKNDAEKNVSSINIRISIDRKICNGIQNKIEEEEMKIRNEWWRAIVLVLAAIGIQTCCQFYTTDKCNQLNKNWLEKIQQYDFFCLTNNVDQSKSNDKIFCFNPFPAGSNFGNLLTKLFSISFDSININNKQETPQINLFDHKGVDQKKIEGPFIDRLKPFYERILKVLQTNICEKWLQGNEWMAIWYTNATNNKIFQKYQKSAQTFLQSMTDLDGNQPSLATLRIPSYSGKRLVIDSKKLIIPDWEEEYHKEVINKVIEYFEKLKSSAIEFPILTKWIPMQFYSEMIQEHGIGIGVTRAVCQQIFDSIHRSKFAQYFQYSNKIKSPSSHSASSGFALLSLSNYSNQEKPYQQKFAQEEPYQQQIHLMQAGCFAMRKSIENEKTKLPYFFFAIGALLRYLLIHNIEIQTYLPFWCFRFLSPQSQTKFHLNDLYQVDPNTARSIQDLYLLEEDEMIEDLYLDFSDLQIDGLSGKVGKKELHQYLDTKINLLFQRQWEKEWIREFYMGFHLTTLDFELNPTLLDRFFSSSNQLSLPLLLSLLCLDPDLVSDRKKCHSSKCFQQEHILPGNVHQRCSFSALVEFLRICTSETLIHFYSFVTGTNHFGSFQSSNSNSTDSNRLYISDNDGSKLPTSTTCIKTLYLYSLPKKKYSSLEIFQNEFNHKLSLAIQNSQFFVLR